MTAPEPGITLEEIAALEALRKRYQDDAMVFDEYLALLDVQAPRLCTAARRGIEADADVVSIASQWKTAYDEEKERGDLWMVDCKKAQAALAEAVRGEREAIELLRQAREYTTKYNAIRGPAARSFPDGNPENAIQVQSGPRPTGENDASR